MRLPRRQLHLSLRQLGELAHVHIEMGPEERAGFDHLLDVPLRILAAEFRTKDAFHAFIARKLKQALAREQARRIAAIFDAA